MEINEIWYFIKHFKCTLVYLTSHEELLKHDFFLNVLLHSKKCWVVLTQIWVKCGQTKMLG